MFAVAHWGHRKTAYQQVVWVHLTTFSIYLDGSECTDTVWIWCPGSFCTFLVSCLFAKSYASPYVNPKSLQGQGDNKYSLFPTSLDQAQGTSESNSSAVSSVLVIG